MKYKYLLFDADNTLFDFDAAERAAFAGLDGIYPGKFSLKFYSVYHRVNKMVWEELERGEISRDELKKERFRRYGHELGFSFTEDDIACISTEYPRGLSKGVELIDGAVEVLDALYGKYSIYIITNGLTDVQTARLNGSKIKKYVVHMYISEEIHFAKPDKRFFDAVLNDIGDTDPASYLVIGDSLTSDIDGAANASIDSCFISLSRKVSDCHGAKYVIGNLSELTPILL